MMNFRYFNDEWNKVDTESLTDDDREYDDTDHEDFVDTYPTKKKDTTYYDDYEEYTTNPFTSYRWGWN